MSDIRELYFDVIIEHGRKPRNFKSIAAPSCCARGKNPLCGDELTLYLTLENDLIKDIGFQGEGCAISMASASLMTEALIGLSRTQAQDLFDHFHALLTTVDETKIAAHQAALGKLAILSGVREFPARVKCATLPWHTLANAMQHSSDRESPEESPEELTVVSTE